MNRRVMHRPMFRKGGSANEGITSGLAPRQGYESAGWVKQVLPTEEEITTLQKMYGERPRSTNLNDFLISFGLDLASRSPQGNIFQTAAQSAKEPFERFQERKMYEEAQPRQERADIINTIIAGKAEALAGESAGSMFSAEQKSAAIGTYTDQLFGLTDDLAAGKITQEEHDRKKIRIWNKMQPYIKDNPEIEALWKVEGYAEDTYNEIKKNLLNEDGIGGSPYLNANGEPVIEDGEQITIAEWFSRPENLPELRKRATDMYLKEAQDRRIGMVTGAYKKGGRAGYQAGELVEQEDVNIQTPQGDVDMQETVEEDMPSDQLSYEELRSRLPVEITDDIVRLLVSSAAALGDFAQIQTQQDVDNFNAKYGVNLVLPSEA